MCYLIKITSNFSNIMTLLCTRIKNITKTPMMVYLYDLQMKNIHDYTTHNGIVHNGGGKLIWQFCYLFRTLAR